MDIESILARHERVALQFSTGRDSLACLYLLRPYLDRITVYWNNTGDAYPESLEVVEQVRAMCPHFVEIAGHQPDIIEQFGIPSDIVPVSHTPMGLSGTGRTGQVIQDRYSCCVRVIMLPLHARMKEDGVTLIIRGQRAADRLKGPLSSGDVADGFEFLFPIEEWSDDEVMQYLAQQDAPVSRFYETLTTTPDCMTCSAYWEHNVAQYLKRHHPGKYAIVQARLDTIKIAVEEHIAAFNIEVNS